MTEVYKIDINKLEKDFKELLEREIHQVKELEKWIEDRSKLGDEIKENVSRNYFAFNGNNNNEELRKAYEYDEQILMPLVKKYSAQLDKYFYENKFKDELSQEYNLLIKKCVNSIELFREENISLEVEESKLSTEYYNITGNMMVNWEGKEKTLQQMNKYMKDANRQIRKEAWTLVQKRRLQDKEKLDEVMDKLIKIRDKKAKNADCNDFREYMFKKLERFSYTPEDCLNFHESVLKYVVPLASEIRNKHKQELNIDSYRPWDLEGIKEGEKPLKPYNNIEELIDGVIKIFEEKDEVFKNTMVNMKNAGTLDLESRKGKSPGGFCDYFPLSKLSCIFMNGAHSQDDLVTLVHEGGHSVHNTLTSDIKIYEYRDMPSETAELASMSMELLSMDRWNEFYKDEKELKRAKREQLEGIITFLPWGILVDRFQHFLYLNPNSSIEERNNKFLEMAKEFQFPTVDFSGYEEELKHFWKKQLHIYEVPFYYIEYAMAQLGALQIWRNYNTNRKKAIEDYKKALSLGSSVSIDQVYNKAGIKFDFSEQMIKELMDFVKEELNKLN
ncbi:oligoendopeptidase F [Clostridium tetanomorphum]|uniref:M3 family oligoendopeptidase n=1 Tax=Clostridium tetanomorphum TaxID=1553 RepID=UPI000450B68F|nr:M3 family oligoendopeptidase [Clostridium tetanomorphum]KAJ52587.1 oligoendopeptidase F [Clostridium tetanomorphum DSM 665]MBP1863179.1 oligoendopeptidase F [Clostridium tetanomorphum]NRS84287.1 oligoendopeptidase F [Clostridium tetanomorphum]SQB92357.1 oligoendopeptidase [Clostridium tetanomorphum]